MYKRQVQGIGNVGYSIVKHLAQEGAVVHVSDVFKERVDAVVEEFGAKPASPDEIYDIECDAFCPCALGGVINAETVTRDVYKRQVLKGPENYLPGKLRKWRFQATSHKVGS